jgi:hypothetical protein
MRTHPIAPVLLLAALVTLIGLGLGGCSRSLKTSLLPNQRPTVRLTSAPVDTTSETFYVYKMNWVGYDPDGRVARFEYVVDPPTRAGVDTPWVTTQRNEQIISFTASKPESMKTAQPRSQGFHVFVIRAVDDRGAHSEPAARAFYSYGIAPTVQIDSPRPSALRVPSVAPAMRIRWSGKDFIDPNGTLFEKPVQYKYKLFKRGSGVPWTAWLLEPDSLRRQFAPGFAGWDSTGPEGAQVQYTNLIPNSEYMFVVVSFARSGAYSPIFSLDANVLCFYVGFAGVYGPQLTMYNSFFQFTYPTGGFPSPLDPTWAVQLQAPSAQPLTFNWFAVPPEGSDMRRYRWVLDLVNLDDETPRPRQDDWYHWSPWSLGTTSATIGPFSGAGGDTGEVHNFYIEAEDINGLVSLGWIQFRVFRPTFDKPLLIVDDTRYNVDQRARSAPPSSPDSLLSPGGAWPSKSELDTFLHAVGGVRWRMTPNGMLSAPGILRGYRYDTLGTRNGRENPTTPLSLLGHYQHLIWMTDGFGSIWEPGEIGGPPTSSIQPMTTLRYMSGPNRQNTLATWVSQGGRLWALGGGFGNATNGPWNNRINDIHQARVYTSVGSRPDLTPGRFMYDLAHWRSEFRPLGPVNVTVARYDQPDPVPPTPPVPGGWTGGRFADPRYLDLPVQLAKKDPVTDPIYPYRSYNDFYRGDIFIEFISLENYITELQAPSPQRPDSLVEVSTLDTLYLVYGPVYWPKMLNATEGVNAMMTVYHGADNTELVFSGHDIWNFRRPDCVGLVDFVLNRMWGLQRTAPFASAASLPAADRPTATSVQRAALRPLVMPGRRPAETPTFMRLR